MVLVCLCARVSVLRAWGTWARASEQAVSGRFSGGNQRRGDRRNSLIMLQVFVCAETTNAHGRVGDSSVASAPTVAGRDRACAC